MRATVSVSQKLKTLHKQILLKVEREREKGDVKFVVERWEFSKVEKFRFLRNKWKDEMKRNDLLCIKVGVFKKGGILEQMPCSTKFTLLFLSRLFSPANFDHTAHLFSNSFLPKQISRKKSKLLENPISSFSI